METDHPFDPNPGPETSPQAASETAPQISPLVASSPVGSSSVAAAAPPLPPAYRDRGSGLVFFGVVQVILGLLSALMVPLMVLSMAIAVGRSHLPAGAGIRIMQFVSAASIYALIAALFVTLGIGSIQMKRWARALNVVFSCYWLLSGALATVLLTAILPMMMRSFMQISRNSTPDASPEMTSGVMAVMLTVIIVFMAFFLIAVPIAFIVFYARNDVAETVRHRDPVERWTDRTPLAVLGGSVVLAIGAAYLFLTGVSAPPFPFFGRYLYGISAAACFLAFAALDFYLAVAIFRLSSVGWWIAVFFMPLRLISMAITFARADMMQAYAHTGMSDEQLQTLNSSPMLRSHVFLWWSLLSAVIIYGYILWLKRYFTQPASGRVDAAPGWLSANGK